MLFAFQPLDRLRFPVLRKGHPIVVICTLRTCLVLQRWHSTVTGCGSFGSGGGGHTTLRMCGICIWALLGEHKAKTTEGTP